MDGGAYRVAVADPLRFLAPRLVATMNGERREDVVRFACAAGLGGCTEAQLLWVDRLGFDVRATLADGAVADARVAFPRPAAKEQEVVSQLTLMAQQLWERETPYHPEPLAA